MSAITTTTIGLPPDHPAVWQLTLTWAGATATIYSLTKPTPTDDGTWDYDSVPDNLFRSGYSNPRLTPAAWTAPVLSFAVTLIPQPGALSTGGKGRPPRIPDDELRSLIREHALPLADRMGPLGFPRTAFGGGPGWSQSNLMDLIADDDRITGGSQRLRAVVRSVLAEVKSGWTPPETPATTARTYPPPALDDPHSIALLDKLLTDAEIPGQSYDETEWREVLYEWGVWYRTHETPNKRAAAAAVYEWLTGWPFAYQFYLLFQKVWDEQFGD